MQISEQQIIARKLYQRMASSTPMLASGRFDQLGLYGIRAALAQVDDEAVRAMLLAYTEMDFATPAGLLNLLGEYERSFKETP